MSKFPSKQSELSDATGSYVKLLISESPNKSEDFANSISMRLLSAIFYGISSFLIIVVNKVLLTTYK